MNAAEKLKALEANAGGFHDSLVIERLRFALPQIVAVVEAAEKIKLPNPVFFVAAYDGEVDEFMPSIERFTSALAALDEALGNVTTES